MTREWVENETTVSAPSRQMTGYSPVYYPNELNLAKATPIHIAAGETAQADLNLRAQPYYPVSIPVMNVPDRTAGVIVTVGEEDGSSGFSLRFNSQTQKIEGLLPNGEYDVRSMSFGQVQSAGAGRIEITGGPVQGAPISLVSSGVIPVVVREEYTSDSDTGPREGLVFSSIEMDAHDHWSSCCDRTERTAQLQACGTPLAKGTRISLWRMRRRANIAYG